MSARQVIALLLTLALVWLLVALGPLLLALAIAWPKREGRHPLLWLLAFVALAFYGVKRLTTPRTVGALPRAPGQPTT